MDAVAICILLSHLLPLLVLQVGGDRVDVDIFMLAHFL